MQVEFPTEADYMVWINEVMGLKHDVAGATSDDQYQRWLDRVMAFRRRYGDSLVPPDVKEAVHSVEDGIGRERTTWNAN